MEDHIPISFEHEGKHYEGYFNPMLGGTSWHLMINKYYHGQLVYTEAGFNFYSNNDHFKDLSEFFGEHIMLWYG